MVKKGALIVSIIYWIPAVLYMLMVGIVIRDAQDQILWKDFIRFFDVGDYGLNPVNMTLMGLYLAMGAVFIVHARTPKTAMKIGSYFSALVILILMLTEIGVFGYKIYLTWWYIVALLFFVGLVIYYVGLIQYRKFFKAGLATGVLQLIAALLYYIIFPIPLLSIAGRSFSGVDDWYDTFNANYVGVEQYLNVVLIIQIVFLAFFGLNALLFSFSKQGDDEEEDELSIEADSAFVSYASEDSGKKKKGKKKDDDSNEIEFTF